MRRTLFVHLAVIGAVAAGISVGALAQAKEKAGNSITIVYNHEGAAAADLVKRGGFSAFVRFEDRALMFDAGGEASVILENLHSLHSDGLELEALVISHNHWDHVFGLPGIMNSALNYPPVYVAASAAEGIKQQYPRAEVIPVDGPKKIAPDVWVTGPLEIEFMGAPLSEQALVLENPDGLHVIVGCSHPGIVAIVERVREMFPETPVAFVGGGFHLRSTGEEEIQRIAADLERLGVQKIGPSHCTGAPGVSIFRDRWGKNFVNFDLGDTYRF